MCGSFGFIYLFSLLPLPPAEILRAPLAHWTTAVPHFHGSCNSFPVSISDEPTHVFHSFHLPKLLTDLSDLMVRRGGSACLPPRPRLFSFVNPTWFVMEVPFGKDARQMKFFLLSFFRKPYLVEKGKKTKVQSVLFFSCFFWSPHLTSISMEICFNGQAGCKTSLSCCLTLPPRDTLR